MSLFRQHKAMAAVVVALAGALTACGGSSSPAGLGAESASAILAAARSAALGANGVVISISADVAQRPEAIVLRYQDATHYEESAALPNGQRFNRLVFGSGLYVQGNPAYLAAQGASPARQAQLNDRWLMGAAPSPGATPLLTQLIDALLTPSGPVAKGTPRRLDGQPVLTVVDAQAGGTLYVAANGVHYPVEVVKVSGSTTTSTVKLTNWNTPINLSVPTSYESLALVGGRS